MPVCKRFLKQISIQTTVHSGGTGEFVPAFYILFIDFCGVTQNQFKPNRTNM